jgi:hypothetical protein
MDTQTDTNSTNEPSKLAKAVQKWKLDGCTSAPDLNVRSCCDAHDIAYQSGSLSRADADKALRHCMRQKGWLVMPWIYWLAVRLFGSQYYKGGKDVDVA